MWPRVGFQVFYGHVWFMASGLEPGVVKDSGLGLVAKGLRLNMPPVPPALRPAPCAG